MDGDLTVVSGSSDGSGRGRLDDGPGLRTAQYGSRTCPNQLGGKQQDWVWLRERELEREQKQERERKRAWLRELVRGERLQPGSALAAATAAAGTINGELMPSINGELSNTYGRASDYPRHDWQTREVHFPMISFVNVDGRVSNLMQEPHLNNQGSSQLIRLQPGAALAAATAAAGTINSELSSYYSRHARTGNGEVLLQFSNRGPASAAVDVGELMPSINGELSNTFGRASDYPRHVWQTREVHFPMISFVNVDGRVSNLMQEPHLNNQGSSPLIRLQPGAALAAATAAAGTIDSELSSYYSRHARTGNGEVLLQFSNRGPASAAVDVGELGTRGILLNDGGVGRGVGIGNVFGASDLDGRVPNLRQEPRLNNQGSSQLINKLVLAITGQTGITLMVAALMNDHSSPFPPAFYLVVAANTVGFITAMISMLLRTTKPWASGVLAKVGAVACSSAIILAMGMALHMRHIWIFLFLCIIVGVAVLFGQI